MHSRSLLLAAVLLLGGCATAGGQTGQESEGQCQATRTPLGLSESSPLGFSGSDVLAVVGPGSTVPLRWLPARFRYGPETGISSLELVVDEPSSVHFVEYEERPASDGRELMLGCVDQVEVTARARFATPGGALAESFTVVLRADSPAEVSLYHPVKLTELSGQFLISAESLGNAIADQAAFQVSFTDQRLLGAFAVNVEETSGDVASMQRVSVACFSSLEADLENCESLGL